jgi:putative restriction endonuclease
MTKAVLTHKPGSIYDDLPEERYHFPATYLRQVEAAVGDFIVYYEPGRTEHSDRQRTGLRSYVATARLTAVRPDPMKSEHYYAIIDPSTYLTFDRPVPFREGTFYYEEALRKDDGTANLGAFGRAVRSVPDDEFEAILRAGFARELAPPELEPPWGGLAEPEVPFERPIIQRLIERPLRDAAFTRVVQEAYGATCSVTGLKIINGRGRAEVQAAHIRPVSDQGPDSVRNGLALSATVHWMFDRGLISIGDPPNYPILISSRGLADNVMRLFNPDGRLRRPTEQRFWPAPQYLRFHRENVFKG